MSDIVAYYNTIAKIYDKDRFDNTYGRFIDEQERKILNQLLLNKTEVVLDLACGSGRLLNYADYGVDASSEMVAISQHKFPDKKIHLADARQTGLADKSIDTIISFHFFMHLNYDLAKDIFQECARILSDNGRIIFDIPSKKRRNLLRHQNDGWHGGFSLTSNEIQRLNANFKIQNSFGILFIPIHRIPKRIRRIFVKLDYILANSFLKEYSSYKIIELVKK